MTTERGDIKKPNTERVVSDIPCPPSSPLESEKLWSGPNGNPNIEVLRDWFFREGKLHKIDIIKLCLKVMDILKLEANVLRIDGAITICGDIHGQFYDLVRLFQVGGSPKGTIYLFLGDYVDRGNFGLECSLLLFAYKILFPQTFFLIRGNHECRQLTAYFNFLEECLYKQDRDVYNTVMDAFDCLPLAAVVNKSFFCCHGGLSPDISTVNQIDDIERFQEPPPSGGMCDILWADPYVDDSSKSKNVTFIPNTARGCSYFFGSSVLDRFLDENQLLCVVRAHEAQLDGYKMEKKRQATGFPSIITLFSAPNYCDVYANKGAILKYHDGLIDIRQFDASPHPFYLPNFLNVFQWNLPFLSEKLTDLSYAALLFANQTPVKKEEEGTEIDEKEIKLSSKHSSYEENEAAVGDVRIKSKIRSAAKFAVMIKNLRENSEDIAELKKLRGDKKIPVGILQKGTKEIKLAISSYEKAKAVDKFNEKRPSFEAILERRGPRARRDSEVISGV